MFGIFESDSGKAKRLLSKLQKLMAKLSQLDPSEQNRMQVAMGTLIHELEINGVGKVLEVRGQEAKQLSSVLYSSASNMSPTAAVLYELLGTAIEGDSIPETVPTAKVLQEVSASIYRESILARRRYLEYQKSHS